LVTRIVTTGTIHADIGYRNSENQIGGEPMSIFTRFRDIINANINGMLDRAENPEKLIRLMIQEMEDTLIEIKAACTQVVGNIKNIEHQIAAARDRAGYWEGRATLAVNKARDDLAREALIEKRRYGQRVEVMENELVEYNLLIDQYKDEMRQLEEKLKSAREKEKILTQRHIHAFNKRRAQEEMRRFDGSEVVIKFDELENRIERMEAEADLINYGKESSLEAELDNLAIDEEIEKELQARAAGVEITGNKTKGRNTMSKYYYRSRRGFYRSRNGAIFGVCRGIAEHFDFSLFWTRVIAVIVFFMTGFWPAVGLYLLAALLMKSEPLSRLHI
jgi:phage shock protein A